MATRALSTSAYKQGAVLSATPAELVVALYDGARRFLRQAAVAMGEREVERTHASLRRAELIIAYLDGILDREQGEIPARLHAIYQFSLTHLNAAQYEPGPAQGRGGQRPARGAARLLGPGRRGGRPHVRPQGPAADASLRPYEAIAEHAELELELAGRGEVDGVAELAGRWEQLVAGLPRDPSRRQRRR